MRKALLLAAILLCLCLPVWSEAQSCDGCGIGYRPSSLGSSGGTLTGPLLLPDGTADLPAMAFSGAPDKGLYRYATSYISASTTTLGIVNRPASTAGVGLFTTGTIHGSTSQIRWTSGNPFGTVDLALARGAANTLSQINGDADQFSRLYGANGGYWEKGVNSELLTIAAAATTDTTGNLLPVDAVIESVSVRVVTVIPTAATFTVGDATTAARFATGVAVAAGTTAVGLLHRNPDVAAAAGPVQSAAAKVRITPNTAPGAATGQVRVQVFFSRWVAPTT